MKLVIEELVVHVRVVPSAHHPVMAGERGLEEDRIVDRLTRRVLDELRDQRGDVQ